MLLVHMILDSETALGLVWAVWALLYLSVVLLNMPSHFVIASKVLWAALDRAGIANF
jgi:hypothetical protein